MIQSDADHPEPTSKTAGRSIPATGAPRQSRVWLDVNFEELDQFTSPNIVCQYCFRPIGLDRSLENLMAELRRKPLIQSTSTSFRGTQPVVPLKRAVFYRTHAL